jgi:hypothetical protein
MAPRTVRSAFLGLTFAASGLILMTASARGQIPEPRVADLNQRSGLLTRFVPIEPVLPHDKDRDTFYDTRWADYPQVMPHPNCYKHNGIYGLRWPADCTQCIYPFFNGAPGKSTLGPNCRPNHYLSRWVQNWVHPFKPVGMYYQNGCYVPIYDLDPIVTGPGPFPWSHFLRPPAGG